MLWLLFSLFNECQTLFHNVLSKAVAHMINNIICVFEGCDIYQCQNHDYLWIDKWNFDFDLLASASWTQENSMNKMLKVFLWEKCVIEWSSEENMHKF